MTNQERGSLRLIFKRASKHSIQIQKLQISYDSCSSVLVFLNFLLKSLIKLRLYCQFPRLTAQTPNNPPIEHKRQKSAAYNFSFYTDRFQHFTPDVRALNEDSVARRRWVLHSQSKDFISLLPQLALFHYGLMRVVWNNRLPLNRGICIHTALNEWANFQR